MLKEWPCVADVTWGPEVQSNLITRAGYSRGVPYVSCTCPLTLVRSCKWCVVVAAELPCLLVPYWVAVSGVGGAAHLPLLASLSESAKMASTSASKVEEAYKKMGPLSILSPERVQADFCPSVRCLKISKWLSFTYDLGFSQAVLLLFCFVLICFCFVLFCTGSLGN